MSKKNINEYIDKLNNTFDNFDLEFETEMIQMRFMSEVERLMEENKVTKTKLAKLIGTSASFITQLFQGNKKLNLETIAKFQNALDYKFQIDAVNDVTRPLSYLGFEDYYYKFNIDNYKKVYQRKNKAHSKEESNQQAAA